MFDLAQTICQITGAKSCALGEVLQSLWSGYGVIQRVQLNLSDHPTAIVKHIGPIELEVHMPTFEIARLHFVD